MKNAVEDSLNSMRIDLRNLERLLSVTMETATKPGALPFTRIPSVDEQARELLHLHGGSIQAALGAAARVEEDSSWRAKLPEVLLQQVPIVGVSTLMLRELWRNIRRCALIAHLQGHDTSAPETQALILTCLISGWAPPPNAGVPGAGGGAPAASSAGLAGPGCGASRCRVDSECDDDVALRDGGGGAVSSTMPSAGGSGRRRLAVSVTRAMVKEVFIRASGLRFAGTVYHLLESAGGLVSGAIATPTGAGGAAGACETCFDGAYGDESDMPSPAKVALVVFAPPSPEERPVIVLMLLILWLLPVIVAAARFVAARMVPLMARRIQMELPLALVVALLIAAQGAGMAAVIWARQNRANFVSIPTTLVFVIHMIIPGTSIFLATRSILQGASEAPYFALLGVCNLASGYLRWADDLSDDAALEKRPVHRVAQARERVKVARQALWVLLVLDFVVEELLGRVCRLHSARFLGPPVDHTHLTLMEYRTLAFGMGLLAAWSQERVLELLRRRTVLLRLLGARQAILAGLSLLLMGVYAFAQYGRTVGFLREVSPTPGWCCMILWIRQFGAVAGAAVPLLMHLLLQPGCFGSLDVEFLVPVALVSGAALGHAFCWSLNTVWREKREHLESDYRVLSLLPAMNAQGRRLGSDAMRLAKKRCAEATTSTAMEWAASRVVRSVADVLAARMLASRVAAAAAL